MKLGRTYNLSVMGKNGQMIPLAFPLTLKFDTTHNTFSDANNLSLQIYNLSHAHQKLIYWDQYTKEIPVPISLYAGYQSSPPQPLIFQGFVKVAYTERLGPDLITHIEAYDGGFGIGTGLINYTAPPKTPLPVIFKNMVQQGLPQVAVGSVVVSNLPKPLEYAQTFCGATWTEMQRIVPAGASLFIADGKCNLLGENDSLPVVNSLGVLQASTGLLGIPRREGYHVQAACIFEPRVKLGQTLQLKTSFASWVNGTYQIIGFKHSGTISKVESGEATTDLSLFAVGNEAILPVLPANIE